MHGGSTKLTDQQDSYGHDGSCPSGDSSIHEDHMTTRDIRGKSQEVKLQ